MHLPSKNAPAAFLRTRHRLADSGLRLDPRAGCRFGLERTGERMLGAAQRHADEKIWYVVGAHPVLIQDECDEHPVSHCVLSKRSRSLCTVRPSPLARLANRYSRKVAGSTSLPVAVLPLSASSVCTPRLSAYSLPSIGATCGGSLSK